MWKRGEKKNQRAEKSGRRRENKRTGEPEIRGIKGVERTREQENKRTGEPESQEIREEKRTGEPEIREAEREQENWRTREPENQRIWKRGERTRELENQRDQGGGTAYCVSTRCKHS